MLQFVILLVYNLKVNVFYFSTIKTEIVIFELKKFTIINSIEEQYFFQKAENILKNFE